MLNFMFVTFAALAVLGALVMAFHRSIVHSAFGLVAALFGVAGLYWTLGADFLGATQVLLYVGGVTVLLLFAVMLSTRETARVSVLRNLAVAPLVGFLGLLLLRSYMGILGVLELHGVPAPEALPATEPTTPGLGALLLSAENYLLPFEVTGVLLLVVLVGAVTLARRETPTGGPS
ncbi:MAG: NADH-quinone oxidoreductase subunit J [Planctomycetota bacterium]